MGQEKLNADYFRNLNNKLSKDSTVKETKFIQKKYNNGNIKCQMLYVRYKKDSLENKYFTIGESFFYYKNGQLGTYYKVDVDTKKLVDTLYMYRENGCLCLMKIFDNDAKSSGFVREIFNLKSLFVKHYTNYPNHYKEIKYKECCKKEYEKSYSFFRGGFILDGNVIYYNKDGTIRKNLKYKMGEVQNSQIDSINSLPKDDTLHLNNPKLMVEEKSDTSGFYQREDPSMAEKPDSINSYYYTNGKLAITILFKDGKELERCTYSYGFFFNTLITTKDNVKHGLWERRFHNGNIKEKRYYYYGQPTGKWAIWDKKGIIIVETSFEGEHIIQKTYQYSKKKKTTIIVESDKKTYKTIKKEKIVEPR